MGQPTGSSAKHMTWSAHQFQFNAFLEADGTVRQLDINQQSLNDAEKAALECDDVRTRESAAKKLADAKPQRAMTERVRAGIRGADVDDPRHADGCGGQRRE